MILDNKYIKFQPLESWSLYDNENNKLLSINESSTVFHSPVNNGVSLLNDLNTTSLVSATNVSNEHTLYLIAAKLPHKIEKQ